MFSFVLLEPLLLQDSLLAIEADLCLFVCADQLSEAIFAKEYDSCDDHGGHCHMYHKDDHHAVLLLVLATLTQVVFVVFDALLRAESFLDQSDVALRKEKRIG